MKCPFPEVRKVSPKSSPGVTYSYPVACGRCAECLLSVRMSKAGQAAMEGETCREERGLGHIWMASPSYSEDNCPVIEPRPIDLGTEMVPALRASRGAVLELAQRLFLKDHPNASIVASGAYEDSDTQREYFQHAQEHMLRHRFEFQKQDFNALLDGSYDAKRTLHFQDIQKWFKRLRKQGLKFRYFVAAEYGTRGTRRPHYHALFYGLTRDEFLYALTDWEHGNTDPNPHTRVGLQRINEQVTQNSNARAAAAYCAKYLAKGKRMPEAVADVVREAERTRSSSRPGLGHAWAIKHLVPQLNSIWYGQLPREFQHLDTNESVIKPATGEMLWHHQGEFFRALGMDTRSRFAKVGGQIYPVASYLRDKIQAHSDCPEELYLLHRSLAAEEGDQEHRQRESNPELQAEYDQELAERVDKHEQREKQRQERDERKRKSYVPRNTPSARRTTRTVPIRP